MDPWLSNVVGWLLFSSFALPFFMCVAFFFKTDFIQSGKQKETEYEQIFFFLTIENIENTGTSAPFSGLQRNKITLIE